MAYVLVSATTLAMSWKSCWLSTLTLPIPECACPIFTTTGYVVLLSWLGRGGQSMVRAGGLIARGMALREAHLAGATSGATSQKRRVRDRQQQGCHTASLSPESNSEPCLPIPPSTTPKCQTFRLCFPGQRHGIGVGDFSGKGKVCFDSEWIIEK